MVDHRVDAARERSWSRDEGLPRPLGATWIEAERAYNFALYSKHAESVTLLLYGERELERPVLRVELDPLRNKSGRIWHCRVREADLAEAMYYAYSVGGPRPNGRYEWHAFDSEKVLLDPYAKAIFFPPTFDRAAAMAPGSNGGRAPLGVLTRNDRLERASEPRPTHEWDTVVYELHVRGFTRHPSSGVVASKRGTFAGLIAKIPYLRELGVTAVELMPVFQFDPASGDCWGYSPLSFFAPHQGYSEGRDAHRELRATVRALHEAGIEVLLDVVYNHTGELDSKGPTYSLKGIDNSTYYLATGDHREPWADLTGTGNTMNCANQMVRSMILDSMRYWTHEMRVDGFRFDLASIFARSADGSIGRGEPPIFGQISGDPDFAHVRLIAEPWDPTGAMEPGRAFPGVMWQQWNGSFRDDVRRFVRGDAGFVPAIVRRLYGSDDLFPDDRMHAYHAWQGVNYVTCHDGFTLYDLVSYNQKRNWANGEQDRDGPAENHSWNCGWEGDENVPSEVLALRRCQAKNFIALLLMANGTPMLRAGDEFLQTQAGNNNPYNQDTETTWLDWTKLETNREMFRFVRLAIAFRKRHPSIGRSRFWREDVRWFGATSRWPDFSPESRSIAYYLDGESQDDDDLYVMINAGRNSETFALHEGEPAAWCRVIDTFVDSPCDFLEPGAERIVERAVYDVAARSVAVLVRRRRR
ncbi:MAG: isoamylase [Gemmatimonadaceae bacterium]